MADYEHPAAGKSFLIADFGATTTNAALFDVAAGAYRLITGASAPTTADAARSDVVTGLQEAIGQISEITGRPLLGEEGDLIRPRRKTGAGIDHFGATLSAPPPLRALIAGLLEDVSVASARRALQSIYAEEVDVFSLADDRSEQARINVILEERPEVILIVGGTDGGDAHRLIKLVETVELGLSLLGGAARPDVIFAGNRAAREQVTGVLANSARIHVADNVRPTLEVEQIEDVKRLLGQLYDELKATAVSGMNEVAHWSTYPLVPTARAFANMIDYFAALYEGPVLGLDLGSHSVTVAAAREEQSRLAVRTDLGVGSPLATLFEEVDPAEVVAWTPEPISPTELANFVQNKALRTYTLPMVEEELLLEQALARQILRQAAVDAGRSWGWGQEMVTPPLFDLLILRGGAFAGAPRPGQALLMALDALQPVGLFAVALDKYGVLPALGLLAGYEPLATVQVLEGGSLVDLGWVVAADGPMEPGQPAVRVIVEAEKKGRLEIDVLSGEIEVLPLTPGEGAELTLRPSRGVDVGFGRGRGKKVTVHGGSVGLVVDARGRPLTLPEDDEERCRRLRQWQWAMGG